MKVIISQEECIGYGACESACLKFFVVKSDEKASVVEKHQTKELDESEVSSSDLNTCIQEAADICPVELITVE